MIPRSLLYDYLADRCVGAYDQEQRPVFSQLGSRIWDVDLAMFMTLGACM
jgi:hypothetical protein